MLVAQVRVPVPGDALPGVTPVEFEEFRLGLDDFLEVETSDEGLGPAFNGTSCAVCHSVPAVGGVSAIAEVRAGRRGPQGEFIALDSSGESLFHLFSVPGTPVSRSFPPRPRSSSGECPFRSLARAWSKRSLTRRCSPSRTRSIAIATASAAGRRSSPTARQANAASGALAGRRSTRRSWRSAPTPIATRWASPTISSLRRSRSASPRTACACAIRFPTPRTSGIRAPAGAASTTSRAS